MITAAQLRLIYPFAGQRAEMYAPLMAAQWPNYGITTRMRAAMFLGQIGHESAQLKFTRELHDGSNYEGRADLGNVNPGDGRRFRGRGLIQLTGRDNYAAFERDMGLPVVAQPWLLEEPENAVLVSLWFWNKRDLNDLCDRVDYIQLTRRINGGLNGLNDRIELWCNAMRVMGVQ